MSIHMTIIMSYLSLECHTEKFHPPNPLPLHPTLKPLASVIFFFYFLYRFVFPQCHIAGIVQCVAFSNWLFKLSNMHLKFLHVFL